MSKLSRGEISTLLAQHVPTMDPLNTYAVANLIEALLSAHEFHLDSTCSDCQLPTFWQSNPEYYPQRSALMRAQGRCTYTGHHLACEHASETTKVENALREIGGL